MQGERFGVKADGLAPQGRRVLLLRSEEEGKSQALTLAGIDHFAHDNSHHLLSPHHVPNTFLRFVLTFQSGTISLTL